VSLFPFLAVLVSAMGALILLLLVVTRKLHNDAVAKAKAEQALIQVQQAAEADASRKRTPLPLPENHPAFLTDAAEFVISILSPAKQLLPPAPPAEPDRTQEKETLRREWEAKLAELRANWDRLQQRLKQGQALVKSQAQQEADLAAELARLQQAINQLQAEKGDVNQEVETAKTTEQTLALQIAELQAELERLQAEKLEQANKFQLVPYAGKSPTQRRPIIIECEANTIRFASEEIPLSARDISGFSPEYNPIRAGTEALVTYWETQRLTSGPVSSLHPEPYLLFVIRPGGTVSYYVARHMLEGLPVDSGYELVTQSQELVWPASTPEAKSECQTAINEVLQARNRLASKMPDSRLPVEDELQYEGAKGEFILFEVQKLRNPSQKTVFGGQRVTRRERSRTGVPGYKAPSAPDRNGFVGPRLEDLQDDLGQMPPRRPSSHEGAHARANGGHAPHRIDPGRPFPIEPPPRIAKGGTAGTGTSSSQPGAKGLGAPGSNAVASTGSDGVGADGAKSEGAQTPTRKSKPSWESKTPDSEIDSNDTPLMTPDELARYKGTPTEARGMVGNYQGQSRGQPAGRGAGSDSGEATSSSADEGAVHDLLSSTDSSSNHTSRKPQDPTNAPEHSGATGSRPGGNPQGDRATAEETTTDPAMSGESKPSGVAGGKGTWNGEGGSSAAAPDSVPVQPGAGGQQPGAEGQSEAGGQPSPIGQLDSTEAAIAKHLPRPWPVPSPNSITAERYVVVTIDSSHVQIGNHSIPIEVGDSDRELQAAFSKELAKYSDRWGRPPKGFHWQPALRFRVRPGGNQYYAWLHSASQDWGLRNSVEYVFD